MIRKSLIVLFAAFAFLGHAQAGAEIVDRVVAVVGGEIITMSDVKAFSAQRSANRLFESTPGAPSSSKDPLDALIREKLLKLEMERLTIAAPEAEVEAAINDVVTRNKITLDVLKGELAKKGMTFEKYKKDVADQIKQMKFLSQVIFPRIKIAEDEVAKKAGANPSEQSRIQARMQLLQARSSEELVRYLDEARTKTFVEIKP